MSNIWKPSCYRYNKKDCKGRWDKEDYQSDESAYYAMCGKPSSILLEFGKGCKYYQNEIYCPYQKRKILL